MRFSLLALLVRFGGSHRAGQAASPHRNKQVSLPALLSLSFFHGCCLSYDQLLVQADYFLISFSFKPFIL